ncbi:polysaccharide deacetylase [Flavobacterium aquaticum]|uniref:Polysaccharide deacetylase n=1 Tax=Flavobacterium aquaticum TaxID=1236486 RepID=A0A327YHY8_9FLAO|nr:polysaccharide deacetylase family protein [Flavobacterium aquaticum]RAK20638.1 polysaccharide deacetylase [Flavobacterium aquaticum]
MPKPISIKLISISLLIGFFFYSCSSSKTATTNSKAGVVITFDDYFVNEWKEADTKLSKYNWKVTFCVSNFEKLTTSDISNLKALQNKGHEIAGHGFLHLNAKEFTKKNNKQHYLTVEIFPLIEAFKKEGIEIKSFAYPFGAKTQTLDYELQKHFKIIRGTAKGGKKVADNSNFYNGTRLANGIGIDSNYEHFSLNYITKVLNYAKKHNKIVVFYGHKPVEKATKEYEVELKTVEIICQFVVSNQMKFYTLRELNSLKK